MEKLYTDAKKDPVFGVPFDGMGRQIAAIWDGEKFTSFRGRNEDDDWELGPSVFIDDPKLGSAPYGDSTTTIQNYMVFHVVMEKQGIALMQRLINIDGTLWTLRAFQWSSGGWEELHRRCTVYK